MKDNQGTVIRLDKLRSNGDDLRTTPAQADADKELRASIVAHGLLEPLVVRKIKRSPILNHMPDAPEWHVIAGHRRLRALRALADAGEIAADAPIDCTVLDESVDTTEAALAENVVRVAMHPADQAVAFARLAEQGATIEEIGNRFGLGKRIVARRIRLAALHPTIMEAYRKGELKEELAHAFACTADQERQLRVWKEIDSWDDYDMEYYGTRQVVDALHEGHADSDSAAAVFVGEDAYREAGGTFEDLLFTDTNAWLDVPLLERLVDKRLQAEAALFSDWKWVHTIAGTDEWKFRSSCGRIWKKPALPTDEQKAELDRLDDEQRALREENFDWDSASEEERDARRAKINGPHNAERQLRAKIAEGDHWTPEQKAAAGVLLYIKRDGELGIIEGLLRDGDTNPDAKPAEAGAAGGAPTADATSLGEVAAGGPGGAPNAGTGSEKKPPDKQPQAVKDAVTALRTATLRHTLANEGQMAIDVMTFHWVRIMVHDKHDYHTAGSYYPNDYVLNTERRHVVMPEAKGASEAVTGYLKEPEPDLSWFDKEQTEAEQFEAYLALPLRHREKLLATAVARLLVPRMASNDELGLLDVVARHTEVDYAAELTGVDPGVWNVDMYWGRLRADVIIAECRPWLGADWAKAARKMKKRDLAADAAERMKAHPAYLPDGFAATAPEREPESESA